MKQPNVRGKSIAGKPGRISFNSDTGEYLCKAKQADSQSLFYDREHRKQEETKQKEVISWQLGQ
jgi:hypothetical protein